MALVTYLRWYLFEMPFFSIYPNMNLCISCKIAHPATDTFKHRYYKIFKTWNFLTLSFSSLTESLSQKWERRHWTKFTRKERKPVTRHACRIKSVWLFEYLIIWNGEDTGVSSSVSEKLVGAKRNNVVQ